MIQTNLASAVGPVTPTLSHVMAQVVNEILPTSKGAYAPPREPSTPPPKPTKRAEWTQAKHPTAKIFTGEPLCSNKGRLDLSAQFTTDAFLAVRALRSWPSFVRPFLPRMRAVRAQLAKGWRLIEPGEAVRRRERAMCLLPGNRCPNPGTR